MSNVLTRIKNNQITDSTILANTKIVPGSIVGSLFNSNLTMTSDVTITGNLIVQGASTYLTVASTNTYVNDPLIVLNNAFSGTNTYDIGLVINRGNQTSTALIWEESAKEFQLIYTTDTGITYGTINNSGYANVHVGNLTVQYASSLGSLATSGNISGWYGSLSGDLLIGGGDLVANTTSFNLLNSTVTNLSFGGAVTTANVGAATGTFTLNNPTLVGSQPTQAVYNTVATTVNAFGAATALNLGAATGIATVNNANVWVPNATSVDGAQTTVNLFTQNATTLNVGSAATTLNLGATSGTVFLNGANVALPNATTIYTGQTTLAFANTNVTAANLLGSATSISIGAVSGYTYLRSNNIQGASAVQNLWNAVAGTIGFAGAATQITIGATTGTANIRNANVYFPNATTIFSGQTSLTFANTVTTTLGIGGATTTLNLGGSSGVTNLLGAANVQATTDSSSTTTGALVVNGGAGIVKTLNVGGILYANSATSSTTNATGGLVVVGGLGVGQSIYARDINNTVIGNTIAAAGTFTNLTSTGTTSLNLTTAVAINNTPIGNATPSTAAFTTLTASGITTITGTTPANSLGGGALQVSGGASVQGNLWVGGNLNIIGNSYVVTSNSGVFYGNAVGAGALYAGVAGYTPQPFTTVQSTGNANNFIQINNQNTNNGTNASTDFVATMDTGNTTVGYIDMGINSSGFTNGAGNELNYPGDGYLYVQGNVLTGSGNLLISTGLANDIVFSLNGQGSANEIARFNYAQNALLIKSTTASTTTTSGALQVAGGVGIGGNLNVGGNLVTNGATTHNNTLTATGVISFTNTTNSTSTSAGGALTVGGGAAFAKDVWIGGTLYVANVVSQTNTILVVQDPLLYLSSNVVYPYSYDIGIYSHFIGGPANIYAHTGVVRDNADNTWKFFSNVAEPSAGTVTFDSNTVYDPIKAGNLTLTVTTDSTNATTGALIVAGGAGIGGNIFQSGAYYDTSSSNFTFAGTPTTVKAFGSATSLTLGSSSGATLTINPTTIVSASSSISVFNTLATTLNIGGAATALNLGASTGIATLNNANVWVPNATSIDGAQTSVNLFTQNATTLNVGAATGTLSLNNANVALPNATTIYTGQTSLNFANTNVTSANLLSSASSISIGAASGTMFIRSQVVNGSSTSVALWNSISTGVQFAGAATALTIGAVTGVANIRNANIYFPNATTIYSGQTTLSVANEVPTTVNAFGAATALNLGAATGILTAKNANVWLPNATTIDGAQTTVSLLTQNATTVSAFTSATTLGIGSTSGTLTVNNPTVIGSQTTQNLYNTVATTMNFAGAATSLVIGATTGTADIRNANLYLPNATTIYSGQTTLDIANVNVTTLGIGGATTVLNAGGTSGVVNLLNSANVKGTTDSTSSTTGALVVMGGAGVAKTLNVGGNATVNATTAATNYATGALTVAGGVGVNGNVQISNNGSLTIGIEQGGNVYLERRVNVIANVDTAASMYIRNLANTGNAISSFVSVSDNGNPNQYFLAMGIAGSGYTNPNTPMIHANDAFLFTVGASGYQGGNLAIATHTANKIISFNVGGPNPVDQIAYLSQSNLSILKTTIATSTTTGALVVAGSAGLGGNIWVANGAVINSSQTSDNFTVKGVNASSLIVANSNYGAVVIGGSNAAPQLGSTLKINSTDSLMIPVGPTSSRPSNSGNIDVQGMIRFNTTLTALEFFDGSAWVPAGSNTTFTVVTDEQYNGDGSNVAYTLGAASTTNGTIVAINGIMQLPSIAYSVSGTTLTFTEAPAPGDLIDVRRLTTTTTVTSVGSPNGYDVFICDNTAGSAIYSGSSSGTKALRVAAKPDGTWAYQNGTKTTYDQTAVSVTTTGVIDSFAASSYTSAKYVVQTKNGSTVETMEALLVNDGSNAYVTTYGVISTGATMGTLSANIVSGNVQLYYNTSLSNSNIKVYSTYIA